jgi:hypothetical protein
VRVPENPGVEDAGGGGDAAGNEIDFLQHSNMTGSTPAHYYFSDDTLTGKGVVL